MSTWFATYGFAEVHPGMFVGAYPLDRSDVDALHGIAVDQVLNLVEDSEYRPGQRHVVEGLLEADGIAETRLRLVDFGHLAPEQIEEAVSTLVTWIGRGQRSYVHCRAGWQRSAAVAAGAIALIEGLDVREALVRVRQRKPTADPLAHQRADLIEWWERRDERRGSSQAG